MPVMSLRLSEREIGRLKAIAREEDKEKSSVARELLADGIKFKTLLAYKEGRVTLSGLGRTLGMNVSQSIDFLSMFGIQSPVSYTDYLQGRQTAKKAVG